MRQKEYIEREGLTIEINFYYDKGGMNYFNSSVEKRGYYLSVSPVILGKNADGTINSVEYTIFSGIHILLLSVNRKNSKFEISILQKRATNLAALYRDIL